MPCVYAPAPPPSPSYTSQFSERPSRLLSRSLPLSNACFCLDSPAGLQPVCIVWWENSPLGAVDQGSGEASGKPAASLSFSSLGWKPTNDQSDPVHAVPWLLLSPLAKYPWGQSLPPLPTSPISVTLYFLPLSIHHSFLSITPSIHHTSITEPTHPSIPPTHHSLIFFKGIVYIKLKYLNYYFGNTLQQGVMW